MKRVAVIGAGASGLPSIKCCLEAGFEPVCFERSTEIGGLWNFKEQAHRGEASVMRSTIINTSKEMMCYSDFCIPKEFPNFMHNTKVMQYFTMYAEKFGLFKYIQFETEVVKTRVAADFEKTGRWELEIRDVKSGELRKELFDFVLLCTGHHADKYTAEFPGEADFQGQRIHSHDYRDHRGYEGKRVVVIGVGNSGGDIAVELGKFGSQVFLSTRRGCWVTNRVDANGLPSDYLYNRNFIFDVRNRLPRALVNWLVERRLNQRFDHALYGLKPRHHFDAQHVTVNDELSNRIASGVVTVKSNIRRITRTGVEFDDGTFEDNIDVIVYATGYTFGFPYVEHKALQVKRNVVNLYKYVFAPDIQPATLAVIGCFQPLGAVMPISEMQCRWAMRVFKGEVSLPPVLEMKYIILLTQEAMAKRYVESQRHTIQVDYVTFMDELARLCGCKVNLAKLFVADPRLALAVYFGPATPYQYRLTGPGAWSGARDAIMTSEQRLRYPLQTRPVPDDDPTSWKPYIITAIVILLFALIVKCLF